MIRHFVRITNRHFFTNQYPKTVYNKVLPRLSRQFSSQIGKTNMEKIVAVGQMRATNDKAANRHQVQQIVESASQQNACVIYTFQNPFLLFYLLIRRLIDIDHN